MKVGEAIAEILKREDVTSICGYPLNYIFDYGAALGIRPIIARTERVGGHMADAISRVTSGQTIGVYATQHGPGIENGMGAIAQAYSESVPLLVLPMGYLRKAAQVAPNFSSLITLRPFVKSVESITSGAEVLAIMRRAFAQLRNGRGGPVVVEIPFDVWQEDVPEPLDYQPTVVARYGPDPQDVKRAVDLLLSAKQPIFYVGQGVHYARAWPRCWACPS
jgi:thiamine pyrophosphate-dependent acetolactate synthase large subunit-like protein